MGPSCIDDFGKHVAWWLLLKYPHSSSPNTGAAYSYLTSAHADVGFVASNSTVQSSLSAMGRTLSPIYAGTVDHIMYSDQPPNTTWSTSTDGHSKGVLARGGTGGGGFFLQHSIPRFPSYPESGYVYGEGQLIYGQHALCVTLDASALESVAFALTYARPHVYDIHGFETSTTDGSDPTSNLTAVANGAYVDESAVLEGLSPTTNSSTQPTPLRLYAKTHKFEVDMVGAILAPSLGASMWSQSWLNTGGVIGAACPAVDGFGNAYPDIIVEDATQLNPGPPASTWNTHHDHSKWAVASDAAVHWSCLNDNNRALSQWHRSGLSVCVHDADLHAALHSVVQAHGDCQPPPPPHSPSPPSTPPTPPSQPLPPLGPPTPPVTQQNCCHFSDSLCAPGDSCCTSSCHDPTSCSYTQSSCNGYYGRRHNCTWTLEGQCVVGGVTTVEPPPVSVPVTPAPIPSFSPLSPPAPPPPFCSPSPSVLPPCISPLHPTISSLPPFAPGVAPEVPAQSDVHGEQHLASKRGAALGTGQAFAMALCGIMLVVMAISLMLRRAQQRRIGRLLGEELAAAVDSANSVRELTGRSSRRDVELVVADTAHT